MNNCESLPLPGWETETSFNSLIDPAPHKVSLGRIDIQTMIYLFLSHKVKTSNPNKEIWTRIPRTFLAHYIFRKNRFGSNKTMKGLNIIEYKSHQPIGLTAATSRTVIHIGCSQRVFRWGIPTRLALNGGFGSAIRLSLFLPLSSTS